MKTVIAALALASFFTLTSCTPTAAKMCESWKETGVMPSPLENCRACYDQLGGEDLNAIRSCAFALDVNNASLGLK